MKPISLMIVLLFTLSSLTSGQTDRVMGNWFRDQIGRGRHFLQRQPAILEDDLRPTSILPLRIKVLRYRELALTYTALGRYKDAERTMDAFVRYVGDSVGEESVDYVAVLEEAADFYLERGVDRKAQDLFDRAVQVLQGKIDKAIDSKEMAQYKALLASALMQRGVYAEHRNEFQNAEEYFGRCDAIQPGSCLMGQARAAERKHQRDLAEELRLRHLRLSETRYAYAQAQSTQALAGARQFDNRREISALLAALLETARHYWTAGNLEKVVPLLDRMQAVQKDAERLATYGGRDFKLMDEAARLRAFSAWSRGESAEAFSLLEPTFSESPQMARLSEPERQAALEAVNLEVAIALSLYLNGAPQNERISDFCGKHTSQA